MNAIKETVSPIDHYIYQYPVCRLLINCDGFLLIGDSEAVSKPVTRSR